MTEVRRGRARWGSLLRLMIEAMVPFASLGLFGHVRSAATHGPLARAAEAA